MKKNKFLRLASVMLMLCLITTCAISGTFAKYTTTATVGDTARVAHWGITITTTDLNDSASTEVFAKTYKNQAAINTDPPYAIGAGASVSSTTEVVAPGTDGGIKIVITGTPEVAFNFDVAVTITNEVHIPKNTVVAPGNTLAADYYPVKFTVNDGTSDVVDGKSLSAVKTYFESLSGDKLPGASVAKTYTVTWEWDFESANDAADTYLGNVAAGVVTDPNTDTQLNFSIVFTATQID